MISIGPNYSDTHDKFPFKLIMYKTNGDVVCTFDVNKGHLEAIMRQCQAAMLVHSQWDKGASSETRKEFLEALGKIDDYNEPPSP